MPVSILDLKINAVVPPILEQELVEYEESTNNGFQPFLDLYRNEWMALIKEYEMERM
jgi:hypothetical protein